MSHFPVEIDDVDGAQYRIKIKWKRTTTTTTKIATFLIELALR